jgi:acetyltransferase-like isoleucine patch superfamily enzyme
MGYTTVGAGASIGTNVTFIPVDIEAGPLVGTGAVVVDGMPLNDVVAGNPAEVIASRD